MERDFEREERLTRVAEAWLPGTEVYLFDDPSHTVEGSHGWTSFGSTVTVDVQIASWLSDAGAEATVLGAEATVLHELAHVDLDHDDDRRHAAARARDEAAGVDRDRGPWEVAADALAVAIIEEVRHVLTDSEASIAYLVEDADRYTRSAESAS